MLCIQTITLKPQVVQHCGIRCSVAARQKQSKDKCKRLIIPAPFSFEWCLYGHLRCFKTRCIPIYEIAFAIPILVIGAAFEEKVTAVLLHLNGSRLITKTTWQHVPVLVGIASRRAPLDWPTLIRASFGHHSLLEWCPALAIVSHPPEGHQVLDIDGIFIEDDHFHIPMYLLSKLSHKGMPLQRSLSCWHLG